MLFYFRVLVNVGDRKRYVSFGRGYTAYEIPEPEPHIEEYIKKVYDQRYDVCIIMSYVISMEIKKLSLYIITLLHY